MRNRSIILAARVISLVFSPFYLPVAAFLYLLFFSYLKYTSWSYRALVLGLVYVFTVLVPLVLIYFYRKVNGWTRRELSRRERRIVPYVLSITSYAVLFYLMENLRMPRFMLGIVAGALVIQVVCALVNPWVKVSTHAAAAGGVIGTIIAFSLIFGFSLILPLCLGILLAGVVCTARLILRQHSLIDLALGLFIGVVCAFCLMLKI